MAQEQWTAVDRYLTDLLAPPDPALTSALADGAAGGLHVGQSITSSVTMRCLPPYSCHP